MSASQVARAASSARMEAAWRNPAARERMVSRIAAGNRRPDVLAKKQKWKPINGLSPLIVRLREARLGQGLSLATLASAIGVNVKGLSNWERGVTNPTLFNLTCWAARLGGDLKIDFDKEPSA